MAAKRYEIRERFNAAVSEAAYARLRALSARYDLGNNYCLTVLLERLDSIADEGAIDAAFRAWREENC